MQIHQNEQRMVFNLEPVKTGQQWSRRERRAVRMANRHQIVPIHRLNDRDNLVQELVFNASSVEISE